MEWSIMARTSKEVHIRGSPPVGFIGKLPSKLGIHRWDEKREYEVMEVGSLRLTSVVWGADGSTELVIGKDVNSMVVFPYRIRPFGEDSSLGMRDSTTYRGPGSPANPALINPEPRSNTIG